MFSERDCQDDRVSLERFLQRLGNNLRANRTSLRFQLCRRAVARDGHINVFAGKCVGQRLADPAESNDCVAHAVSPISLLEAKFEKWVRGLAELKASLGTAMRSDLRHAASDGELDAGNVRTLIRGEECNCCRDFFGLAPAAERNL